MRARALGALSLATVALASAEAGAVTFSAEGVATLDPSAVLAESFESGEAPKGVTLVSGDDALHGGSYAVVDSFPDGIDLPVAAPPGKAAYVARAFARKNRLFAQLSVGYADGGAPGQSATLFPTGKVTSDGWYELASAPLSVDGDRAPELTLSITGSKVELDAVEVVPSGTFRPTLACSYVHDPACGPDQLCSSGYCRDGDLLVPPLPADEHRGSVVDYLEERLKGFFGGVYTRSARLPLALATLESMRKAESAWAFWNGFATGLHRLHDWHTQVHGPPDSLPGRGALPICVVEGKGDLSHDLWPPDPSLPDVLVSHVGPEGNSGLKPGDRIVAVNGLHPIAFAESLDDTYWGYWRSDDPEGHAEALERLRYLIRRWARSFTVVRCDASKACSPPETILVSSLPTTEPQIYPDCDHRPGYHLESGNPDPVQHTIPFQQVFVGKLAATDASEGLYGAIFDDVYLEPGQANPYQAPLDELRAKAKGVVLDHRRGNGGTEPAATFLTTLFRTPPDGGPLWASTGFVGTYGWFDAPFSSADGASLFGKLVSGGGGYEVGADDARLDLRAAVLTARDGSASDYLLLGLRGSGANVRVFGRRTAGAFSSFIMFDYFGSLGFQIASGDTFAKDGTGQIGKGVVPDEEVLPLQSDLVSGKDTAHERALTWLREGK